MPRPFSSPSEGDTGRFLGYGTSLIEMWLNTPKNEETNHRIAISPQVCHGQACIQGTRIPVYQILRMLACGDGVEDLLREYPSVTRKDILACIEYAASLVEEQGSI